MQARPKTNAPGATTSFTFQQSSLVFPNQQSQQQQQLSFQLPQQQQQMFNLQQQTRLPYNLTIRYGDQKENRIENVERNRKMNLLLSHPELPESARIEVPAELRADQKEWNKVKKEAEVAAQRRYRLELTVLNEEKAKVEQCSKCRKSNESKTRSFVRVRSSHIYCKNKSISLPVKFGCIPSHQDNRPKELFIEIKLIAESMERLEFYSLVPLRFRKHKRKRSSASKLTSPITSPTTLSPLTSPRGSQWNLQEQSPNYWSNIEEGTRHLQTIPAAGYPPPSSSGVHSSFHWTDITGSHYEETSGDRSSDYSHQYGIKSESHDHMVESPLYSPHYLSAPGSPYSPRSGYNSPPYDEFDFTGAAQISTRLMEAGRAMVSEIDQLPMYLQKLRLQELEDKNKRLEDENMACKRMLDECKRVLKTATMEIERLNYKLTRKTEEASAERRAKEQAQKQVEELKAQRVMMGSGGKLNILKTDKENSKNNPFAVKEDIDAVRKGLKPVIGEWPTTATSGSTPPQQDPTTLEFTCKARLSSAYSTQMPYITTINGSPIHPSQGGQPIPQSQFTFGIYNSPPSSWS